MVRGCHVGEKSNVLKPDQTITRAKFHQARRGASGANGRGCAVTPWRPRRSRCSTAETTGKP
jgi:hypothetical protein